MSTWASQTLNKAADYIEEHGWVRKVYSDDNAVCAMGAINLVSTSCVTSDFALSKAGHRRLLRRAKAMDALVDHLAPDFRSDMFASGVRITALEGAITTWNDGESMTKEQVVHELRIAAKEASGE
jgi:hypothetical protein